MAEIKKQLKDYYDDHIQHAIILNQKITTILDSFAEDDEIERTELQNELNQVQSNMNNAIQELGDALNQNQEAVESPSDTTIFEILMRFRDTCENFKSAVLENRTKLNVIEDKYKISKEAVLSRKMRKLATLISNENSQPEDLKIYKLPINECIKDPQKKIRRLQVGNSTNEKLHRHILLMGMTGSGKSLLINNIVNYIYGVSYTDRFRFKLIFEKEEICERGLSELATMADSMTTWVSSYTFHWQEGFRVPYSITIYDTPGFGDTRGLEFDTLLVSQIRSFFNDPRICPEQELTCIGLVIQASTARITDEQKYIFDQVLGIFGRDMSTNIFLIFTFADAEDPPALKVVEANKIPFVKEGTFKFNNSAVYASGKLQMTMHHWDFGYQSLKLYFDAINKIQNKSLILTKQVLHKREQLRLLLSNFQEKIFNGLETLREIQDNMDAISRLSGTIEANRNFKLKKNTFHCHMESVPHPITNCTSCKVTCHAPCDVSGNRKKACAAMDEEGICEICPGKCSFEDHINGTSIYIYTPMVIEETIESMMNEYSLAMNEHNSKKQLLENLLSKYKIQKKIVYDAIKKANSYHNHLEKIALRNAHLTDVEYIDRLIYFEEINTRPNKTSRIRQLRDIKQRAEILRGATDNPDFLTLEVNTEEDLIRQRIESLTI